MHHNKETKLQEYKKLRDLFDQRDVTGFIAAHEIGIDYVMTDVGIFLPSGTTFLDTLFQDLIGRGFINPDEVFLDAGSGDGRVSQIASLNGIKTSMGIEYSHDILKKSKQQTKVFEDAGILDTGSVILIPGDFAQLETYTREDISPKSIRTFFNYLNSWKGLLQFVQEHSTSGTKVILVNEQFDIEKRVVEGVGGFDSIMLKKIFRYVYWKDKDQAALLTPELLEEIKRVDETIEQQHLWVDIAENDHVSVRDNGNYKITTVYLCEKV